MSEVLALVDGNASQEALADTLAEVTVSLLCMGDQLVLLEGDAGLPTLVAAQPGVLGWATADMAAPLAVRIDELVKDPLVAGTALATLLGVPEQSLEEPAVTDAVSWLLTHSPDYLSEKSKQPGEGDASSFEVNCLIDEKAQVPSVGVTLTRTLTTCTDAALQEAVAAGGTVLFGVDCPSLQLTRPLAVGPGLTVTLDANGHTVVLDAHQIGRHADVTGGSLTILGVELRNGLVTGRSGSAAASGHPGDPGDPGTAGSWGSDAHCSFGAGDSGEAGQSGAAGADGAPGSDGGLGLSAQGGSIRITAGTVALTRVTLSNNRAQGGTGGRL